MTDSSTEKGKILSMLEEIHGQLEELESVLEDSFSDHRNKLNMTEREKIFHTANKLSIMENKVAQLDLHSQEEQEIVYNQSPKVQNLNLAFK
ncbi:hypothetical protein [Neobacillus mesonae]|uniref:Uncharacterized protein n=1 Tax=Neobacillus mesonae TaxID=1193713 RepID=A0A3T0I193_9BACI|nr:hypothetical protein [Neobacillus mesonae]AZU63114.1 hypothetical protein CHR53_18655 [Neobacillus mesonae]